MKGKEILYIESHANLLPSMTSDGKLHQTDNVVFWSDLDRDVLDSDASLLITNVTCINLCAWRNDIDYNSVEFKRYVRRNIKQVIHLRTVQRYKIWLEKLQLCWNILRAAPSQL